MPTLEFTMVESIPNIKQTLRLSILFLEKFERLTNDERKVFCSLLNKLTNPLMHIKQEIKNGH